jgi:two-component system, sensor histidine kinase RegB
VSRDPQIVLTWIARLRWLAAGGQLAAIAAATLVLGLRPPLLPIAAVVLLTLLTNIALVAWMRRQAPRPWLVPAVLLLDMGLLTLLLYLTGGADNPFSILFLVHVALAVVVLSPAWMWAVAGAVAMLYGLLVWQHLPLVGRPLSPQVMLIGHWSALVLVAVLIAYFIGRLVRELRQREAELAGARELATRNQRLAALTTLAAGAAHELGTPLATIAVVARELELASAQSHADDAILEDARLIRQQVDRCRAILTRMRADVAEESARSRAPAGLQDLLRQLRHDLTDDERPRFEMRCEADLGELADPALAAVHQALGVLVRNAFDASPAQGAVALSIQRRQDHISFEVRDHGCGMPEEVLRRAGEPFFTTKDPGHGMGLGLFLVRLVAEKFGGALKLQSAPGQGTRCVLELPADKIGAAHES